MHSVEGTFTTCININAPDQSSSCHIFLECWWRKLAKNQRSLPAFFLGPKAHVHDPVHVLLVGLNHMHGPMQNFLVCFGAPKLYAFPICKCYAFLNILLGYPLCLTTTHKITGNGGFHRGSMGGFWWDRIKTLGINGDITSQWIGIYLKYSMVFRQMGIYPRARLEKLLGKLNSGWGYNGIIYIYIYI